MLISPRLLSRWYRAHWYIGMALALLLGAIGLRPGVAADLVAPSLADSEWIWFPEGSPDVSAPEATRWFRKTFDLPVGASVKRATLVSTCDDAQEVYLNGNAVGSSASWNEVTPWNVTRQIQTRKKKRPRDPRGQHGCESGRSAGDARNRTQRRHGDENSDRRHMACGEGRGRSLAAARRRKDGKLATRSGDARSRPRAVGCSTMDGTAAERRYSQRLRPDRRAGF